MVVPQYAGFRHGRRNGHGRKGQRYACQPSFTCAEHRLNLSATLFRVDVGDAVAPFGSGLEAGLVIIEPAIGVGAGRAVTPTPRDAERWRTTVSRGRLAAAVAGDITLNATAIAANAAAPGFKIDIGQTPRIRRYAANMGVRRFARPSQSRNRDIATQATAVRSRRRC